MSRTPPMVTRRDLDDLYFHNGMNVRTFERHTAWPATSSYPGHTRMELVVEVDYGHHGTGVKFEFPLGSPVMAGLMRDLFNRAATRMEQPDWQLPHHPDFEDTRPQVFRKLEGHEVRHIYSPEVIDGPNSTSRKYLHSALYDEDGEFIRQLDLPGNFQDGLDYGGACKAADNDPDLYPPEWIGRPLKDFKRWQREQLPPQLTD